MKNVWLIAGFLADSLIEVENQNKLIWFNPLELFIQGVDPLALQDNGSDPLPPAGLVCGPNGIPRDPWRSIINQLRSQLDLKTWRIGQLFYDWRKLNLPVAVKFAETIRETSTVEEPATLVGHSNGGLVALHTWAQLVSTGHQGLIRRIITIGTPFRGSYFTGTFLGSLNLSMDQIVQLGAVQGFTTVFAGPNFGVNHIRNIALTWPGFYELLPALVPQPNPADPFRGLLYFAGNYPLLLSPKQTWLDYVNHTLQPLLLTPAYFPPSWVMTTVSGFGVATPQTLASNAVPINFADYRYTLGGDGVVTSESASRSPGLQIGKLGDHFSLPLAAAQSGELADWIVDSRGPLSPTPINFNSKIISAFNTTAEPQSDPVTGLVCLSGG